MIATRLRPCLFLDNLGGLTGTHVAELFDQLIIAGAPAAGIVYCFFTCRLEGRCMLQFLTSWQVLLAFATFSWASPC